MRAQPGADASSCAGGRRAVLLGLDPYDDDGEPGLRPDARAGYILSNYVVGTVRLRQQRVNRGCSEAWYVSGTSQVRAAPQFCVPPQAARTCSPSTPVRARCASSRRPCCKTCATRCHR